MRHHESNDAFLLTMISRRTMLKLAVGSFAGIGVSAPSIVARCYVNDLSGFVADRSDAAAAEANRHAISSALAAGIRTLYIRPGTRFAIDRRLDLPSGAALVGEGTGEGRPVIVMPAGLFTHRSLDADQRYSPAAVGIMVTGEQAGEASRDVRILNLDLRCERRDARVLRGVLARNAIDLEISDVHVSGLPVGVAFCLASVRGNSRVSRCRAHDCRSDMNWGRGAHPQITGLEIDNDRVAGIGTRDLLVENFRAEDLTVGPAFAAAHGWETDGINICATEAVHNRFRTILVRNVGEGIDTFGCDSLFEGIVAENCRIFGLKCVHGASRNLFDRPVIRDAGLAAITVQGSDRRGDSVGNRFVSPRITGIDPEGRWAASNTAAILISDNGGRTGLPRDTLVTDAAIDAGPRGKTAWLDTSHGSGNRGRALRFMGQATEQRTALIQHGGGSADFVHP